MIKPFSIYDFIRIPDYFHKKDVQTGCLIFDETLCVGCGICERICPGRGIKLIKGTDKKRFPVMVTITSDITTCMACGDCLAACPQDAISIQHGYNTRHFYRKLSQKDAFSFPKKY